MNANLREFFNDMKHAFRELGRHLAHLMRRTHHTRNEAGLVRVAGGSDVAARVARGAALLDKKQPGWDRDVDPNFLQIESPVNCVLGQTFGHYETGRQRLHLHGRDETSDHGFNANLKGGVFPDWLDFVELNVEWRREIKRRQKVMV